MMSDGLAPWFVKAKVSPPRLFVNACVRQALLDDVLQTAHGRVVFVEAPAGFGKTLLLLQLREAFKAQAAYVGWISLDHTDEPDMFVPYLAYAFHQAGLDMSATDLLSPSFHGKRTAYSLGRLLSSIEDCGKPCVLVLDDFENSSAELINEVFEPLLRMQPDNLRLVFACRYNPGLPLSGLAVEGGLTVLNPQQLMFTREEVMQLFDQVEDADEIDFIMERTKGWPVAIQLLRSFGHQSSLPVDKLHDFSGSNREVAGYLREQLFLKLAEEEQLFLRDTAMLDPVSVECADAIRGRADSREIIQRLDYLGGLFAPLEGAEEAYRLHPLVREYFYNELRENAQERFLALNRAAARWFAANDKNLAAMRYALAAGDENLAGEIFEEMGGLRLWLAEGMSRLSIGLDLIKDAALENFPQIHLARSLRHAKNGEIKQARECYEYAAKLSDGFKRDRAGGNDTALFVDAYYIETMLVEYGCTPSLRLLKTESLDFILTHACDEWVSRGYARLIQCVTHLQAGDFAESRRFGEICIEAYREGHSLYGELFTYFHFGMGCFAQADTQAALREYHTGLRIARTEFPGDKGLQWITNALQGELFWEMGDNGNARKHLRYVVKYLNQLEAWFDIYMVAYQAAAQYLWWESGYDAAMSFLDKVQQHAREQELHRLETVIIAIRVSLACFAGEDDAARAYAGQMEALLQCSSRADIESNLREVEAISLARIRVAILDSSIEECRALIREFLQLGESKGHRHIMLNALLQQAILEQQSGRETEAVKALAGALEMALPGGISRPFLLERQHLEPLLERVLETYISSIKPNAEQYMEFVKAILNEPGNGAHEPGSSFTRREREILAELAGGQPDKVIARSLGLSAHGVRYHLKNIYGKMGVKNRVQAISKAREYGLID